MSPLGNAWLLAIGSRPGRPTTVDDIGAALTDCGITGATLLPALGLWQGCFEDSVVALLAGLTEAEAVNLARCLADRFTQESVYLQAMGLAYLVGGRSSSAGPPTAIPNHADVAVPLA